jgi:hypothetical protein
MRRPPAIRGDQRRALSNLTTGRNFLTAGSSNLTAPKNDGLLRDSPAREAGGKSPEDRDDDLLKGRRVARLGGDQQASLRRVEPKPPPDTEANSPTRSIYGREYWLRRCEGFLVETPTKRLGRVSGIRYGETTNEPEVLEVRAGWFGRTQLLISIVDVLDVDPELQRLTLADPPPPAL